MGSYIYFIFVSKDIASSRLSSQLCPRRVVYTSAGFVLSTLTCMLVNTSLTLSSRNDTKEPWLSPISSAFDGGRVAKVLWPMQMSSVSSGWITIFFFHIYLARVSRLMSKSFYILCISPASTNRNVNKFTKCEHFTASNKCRAVSFGARSSLMFCLIWIGAAWSAPLAACTAGHTRGAFFPASRYILRLATSVKLRPGL